MTNIQEEIYKSLQNLSKRVGNNYQVLPNYLSSTIMDLNIPTSGSSPDFVVYEPKNGQVTLVEIKGSERNRDLPLATIPAMRNLIEAYKDLHPRVVLVTGSGIPSNLMKQLSDENIIVIQFVDEESAISELITVLEGKEQGER